MSTERNDGDEPAPPPPDDLGEAGTALWKQWTDEIHFEVEQLHVLAMMCRQATLIARLEEAVAKNGTRVKGSAGQWVIAPEISELRMQKTAFLTAMRALQIEGEPGEDGKMTRSESGKHAANVRWGNA